MDDVDRASVRVLARRTADIAQAMGRRLLQESFTAALAAQWRRRAEVLEWCRPRPGDFNGRATPEDLAARDARLARGARLCRVHARLIEQSNGAEMAAELDDMLAVEGLVA